MEEPHIPRILEAKIAPRIGYRSSGKYRVRLTPDLVLDILVAMMNHDKWEDRIKEIEEKRPELKGHFKRKNMVMKADKYKWPKLVRELKEQIAEKAMNEARELKERNLESTTIAEQDNLEFALEQLARIRNDMKDLKIGSKEYGSAMKSLVDAQNLVEKLGGTKRVRDREAIKDKVEANLFLADQKQKMLDQQKQLGAGGGPIIDSETPTFLGDEDEKFLLE